MTDMNKEDLVVVIKIENDIWTILKFGTNSDLDLDNGLWYLSCVPISYNVSYDIANLLTFRGAFFFF